MAKINYPDNPSDGDRFGLMVYNATLGVWEWDVLPGNTTPEDLGGYGPNASAKDLLADGEYLSYGVDYLVIAGGGCGGSNSFNGGINGAGGGGAGGYRTNVAGETSGGNSSPEDFATITFGESFSVAIGAGGGYNTNGSNSSFKTIVSTGGGRGGGLVGGWQSGASGGSGGAGSAGSPSGGSGISGQGTSGSGSGSGGGSFSSGSSGGAGTTSSITGTPVTRAAGGTANSGPAGAANSGTGGCGRTSTGTPGTNGGSGVVILRYPKSVTLDVGPGLSATTSTVGNYKVTQFTAGADSVTVA